MASAILSSIKWMINNVVNARSSSKATPASLVPSKHRGVQEDLLKLERTLQRIQAVLSDAEEREIRDEQVKLWMTELKGLAYDAEDVLRDYGYEILRAIAEGQGLPWPTTGKRKLEEVSDHTTTTASIYIPTEVAGLDDMAHSIQEIRMRFDEIAEARKHLCLREDDGLRKVESSLRPPPTTPHVNESCVYGREDDKERIVEMLVSESGSGEKFSVIPIVGMGGIGKTTLVRLVYNDSKVQQYFNLRVWVSVSLDFDVVKLCKAIIQSITKEPCELTELSALQHALKEELKGKKLLLVLDDVWNEKLELWDNFRVALIGGGLQKIIITTRNVSVARIMQTVLPYHLGCLPEEQSWLLFERCAFEGIEPKGHPNLIEIGKKIATKCNGLPLALKTLGGLLRFETAEERWEDILRSDLWELDEQEDDVLPALKLSYHWMPTHLKPCFLYCSLFPKNYLFKKDQLVRLWLAQGLIQYKENRRDEDTGRQYFDDLLRRSFFQYSQIDQDELPRIRSGLHLSQVSRDEMLQKFIFKLGEEDDELFVMHDLICDLAQSIAGKECCIIKEEKGSDRATEARHLSLIPNSYKEKVRTKSAVLESRGLRTLLYINRMVSTWDGSAVGDEALLDVSLPKDLFLKLGCLRVIDLSYTRVKELPDSVSHLKHLCYLGLQGSKIQRLPDSICKLYYLQTLDLKYCKSLRELPKGIVKLINLRHLELPMKDFASSVSLPPGIGKLSSLQTLSAFNVGRDGRHCRVDELKQLRNLRGLLGIAGLENVASSKEAREANLQGKEHLQTLALSWSAQDGDQPSSSENRHTDEQGSDEDNLNMEGTKEAAGHGLTIDKLVADGVLESLQPNSNLVELLVRGYYGTQFPSWLGDQTFSRLTVLMLSKCHNCKFLPPLGRLPCLEALLIEKMNGVQHIGSEFFGHTAANSSKAFQALKQLDVAWLNEWEEWNGFKDGDFPRLNRLVIKHCSKLRGLPLLSSSSVEQLELEDVEGLTALPALPSLKSLDVGGKWNGKLWSSSLQLKTLQSLKVSWSENLTILHLHENLFKLKDLEIEQCPNLTSVTGLHELPSIEGLELTALPELQFSPDYQIPSTLKTFWVTGCANMTILPLRQHLPLLKELSMVNCPQLVSVVSLQNLVSLESLTIAECPELLLSFDEVLPPSLQSLEVSGCDKLISLPLLHENLIALKELKIENCQQLTTVVGLRNLAALECLEISFCPLLHLLPDEQLRSSNLDIDIVECPGLTEWCQRHGIKQVQNDDWDDEALDDDWDDKELDEEDLDDDKETERESEGEEGEEEEKRDGPEAEDDID